jgi:hypothetical protein
MTQHEVATAYERGWSRLKNGELLDAAEKEGYAVLVTTDLNLKTPTESPAPAYGNRRPLHAELAADSARECFGGPGD